MVSTTTRKAGESPKPALVSEICSSSSRCLDNPALENSAQNTLTSQKAVRSRVTACDVSSIQMVSCRTRNGTGAGLSAIGDGQSRVLRKEQSSVSRSPRLSRCDEDAEASEGQQHGQQWPWHGTGNCHEQRAWKRHRCLSIVAGFSTSYRGNQYLLGRYSFTR